MNEELYYKNLNQEVSKQKYRRTTKFHVKRVVGTLGTTGVAAFIGSCLHGDMLSQQGIIDAAVCGAIGLAGFTLLDLNDSFSVRKAKAALAKIRLDRMCKKYNKSIGKQKSIMCTMLGFNPTDDVKVEVRYPDSPDSKLVGLKRSQLKYSGTNTKGQFVNDPDDVIKFCVYAYRQGQSTPYRCLEIGETDDLQRNVISYIKFMDSLYPPKPGDPHVEYLRSTVNLKDDITKIYNKSLERTTRNSQTGENIYNEVSLDHLKTVFEPYGGYSFYLNKNVGSIEDRIANSEMLAHEKSPELFGEQRSIDENIVHDVSGSQISLKPAQRRQTQTQTDAQTDTQQPAQTQTVAPPVQDAPVVAPQPQPVVRGPQTTDTPKAQPQQNTQRKASSFEIMKYIYDNLDSITNDVNVKNEVATKFGIQPSAVTSLVTYIMDHNEELEQKFAGQQQVRNMN